MVRELLLCCVTSSGGFPCEQIWCEEIFDRAGDCGLVSVDRETHAPRAGAMRQLAWSDRMLDGSAPGFNHLAVSTAPYRPTPNDSRDTYCASGLHYSRHARLELGLKNIGPFNEARIEFLSRDQATRPGVTLLTGMNGTGKTILIDAIRGFFGSMYGVLEREIWRPKTPFQIELTHSFHADDAGDVVKERVSIFRNKLPFFVSNTDLWVMPQSVRAEAIRELRKSGS